MKKIKNILLTVAAFLAFSQVVSAQYTIQDVVGNLTFPTDDGGSYTLDDSTKVAFRKQVSEPRANGNYWIKLEAFTTGSSVVKTSSVPSDVILVLDVSTSMTKNKYGSVTRLAALKAAGVKPINRNPECADLKGGKVPPPYSVWQDTLKRRTNGVFRLDTSFGEGDSSSLCAVGVPVGSFVFPVRDLKPGEWVAVEASAKGENTTVGIGWQNHGKWCKRIPGTIMPLDGDDCGWKHGRAFVRVPVGADGFGRTLGVRQQDGEKAWFDNIRVYKIAETNKGKSEKEKGK